MELLDRIKNIEDEYTKLTSNIEKYRYYTKYIDNITPDIPQQNYIFIKKGVQIDRVKNIVLKERDKFLNEKRRLLRFVFDPESANSGEIPELSDFNFNTHSLFILDLSLCKSEFADSHCFPVTPQDKKRLYKLHKKQNIGIKFSYRYIKRWIKIKFYTREIETVVYSKNGAFLGSCELFFKDNVVKLEDFEVLKEFRTKRVGEAIMKSAVSIAKSRGCKVLYLTTDKYSWVADYYQRRGFYKYSEYNSCTMYGRI
ncbi:GNAT family N-acetyltransferase [Thiospirochaeta perfilievii]|uniref:GNAT family N-acetyltransferase n=1 Tax=Thiospirochaeta perfilievii TaxID=252967 RepID=A0A5C1QBL3_9SPIO|nr:GNAT family N-acetyltransferase [Thiospirochaeta perfilievii]QEN04921.1 GNAT family N-acetyltransferase [Thiospirochaeta perfilievii]